MMRGRGGTVLLRQECWKQRGVLLNYDDPEDLKGKGDVGRKGREKVGKEGWEMNEDEGEGRKVKNVEEGKKV